jgi:hypothetical protein
MTAALHALLAPAYPDRTIRSISTRRYPYASSFRLDEVIVELDDGERAALIRKDFARSKMLPDARRRRPTSMDDPSREIETYRRVLVPAGIGPRCLLTMADAASSQFWLITEKVRGVELWQIGDINIWEDVVRWLSGLHEAYADRQADLLVDDPHLPILDEAWFDRWTSRAMAALATSTDERAPSLRRAMSGLDLAAELGALPRTFVHGEFYSSNVIVGDDGVGTTICPVDWETAALGTGMIDLAAITSGWDAQIEAQLVSAYGPLRGTERDLQLCRLHLALRWIGWLQGWSPPAAHAQDWIGAALDLASRLGR